MNPFDDSQLVGTVDSILMSAAADVFFTDFTNSFAMYSSPGDHVAARCLALGCWAVSPK
ncbi:MAG: hypothetical protein HQ546_00445 [Planctomycetes bacterium]|nr:hypothetical protein [Planctomycetota bacterium]